jgi:hypothetical protein
MKPSKAFVIVFTGAMLVKEFDSQPFDQPHLHSDVAAYSLDFSVTVSASGSPNATAWLSSYPPRK